MVATKEKFIENQILMFLREIGIFCWKNQSVGIWNPTRKAFMKSKNAFHIKGVSDILGVLDGKILAIEVKSKIGRPSREQLDFIQNIQKHGGVAFISRSVSQTYEQLKPFMKNADKLSHIVIKYKEPHEN